MPATSFQRNGSLDAALAGGKVKSAVPENPCISTILSSVLAIDKTVAKFSALVVVGPRLGCTVQRIGTTSRIALYSAVVKVATGRGVPMPHLPDRKKCFIGSNAAIKNVMQADDELMTEVYLKCMVATVPAQNQGKKRKAAAPAAAQHKPKRSASSGASSSGASSSTGVRLCLGSHGQPCATNLAGLEPWKKRCLSCYRAGNKVQRPTSTTWS